MRSERIKRLKLVAQGTHEKRPWIKSIITLGLIIALTWYARQGQNNPFRALTVLKIRTTYGVTVLERYSKKGEDLSNRVLFPLTSFKDISNSDSISLKEHTLIQYNNDDQLLKILKTAVKDIESITNSSNLKNSNSSFRGVVYSEPLEISGLSFKNIFIDSAKTPLALAISSGDINMLFIENYHKVLDNKDATDLKERFHISILTDAPEKVIKDIREILRPEYLLVITDNKSLRNFENIVYINPESTLRISKDIKGMITIKN